MPEAEDSPQRVVQLNLTPTEFSAHSTLYMIALDIKAGRPPVEALVALMVLPPDAVSSCIRKSTAIMKELSEQGIDFVSGEVHRG